jgi:hypothetical protein
MRMPALANFRQGFVCFRQIFFWNRQAFPKLSLAVLRNFKGLRDGKFGGGLERLGYPNFAWIASFVRDGSSRLPCQAAESNNNIISIKRKAPSLPLTRQYFDIVWGAPAALRRYSHPGFTALR